MIDLGQGNSGDINFVICFFALEGLINIVLIVVIVAGGQFCKT